MSKGLKTGENCTIASDVEFGKDVTVHGFANLYGCRIGNNCRIGTFVEIQRGAILGDRVRIQSHSFICSDVVIEDDVFVGHSVSFVNDRYPTATKAASGNWKAEGIRICRGASIGTGAVILCGVEIGEGAVVGAGSVVTCDVSMHSVFAGNPAKMLRILSDDEQWKGGQSCES